MPDAPTLLLVEDDNCVRRILKDTLAETGIELRLLEASDGVEPTGPSGGPTSDHGPLYRAHRGDSAWNRKSGSRVKAGRIS